MEAPYFGAYGNNVYSPRYIETSPSFLTHSSPPQYNVVSPTPTSSLFSPPPSSLSENQPNYYQIQPPSPGEMVIIRTTTVTRSTTAIQPIHSTF